MSPLADVLRGGLERLVARYPDALEASAALRSVFATPCAGQIRRVREGSSEETLLAAAGSVLVDPDFAVAAGGCLRPVAMHALANGLDALLALDAADTADTPAAGASESREGGSRRAGDNDGTSSVSSAVRHERACAALGALVHLLPHVKPVAARYLRRTAPPFARVARGVGASERMDTGKGDADATKKKKKRTVSATTSPSAERSSDSDAHVLLVARACVRLLDAFERDGAAGGERETANAAELGEAAAVDDARRRRDAPRSGSSPLRSWNTAPLLRLLRHACAEVRWTTAMALERVFSLPSGVASRLRGDQAPDADERHAFAERWAEHDAAVALERAAAFLDPDGIEGSFEATRSAAIAPFRGAEADIDDADDADDARPLLGADLPAAPGHARVGGVELRRRRLASSDEFSRDGRGDTESATAHRAAVSATRRGRAMVRTRSAMRNVEATALALCQNRPLLLEGPAGCGKSAILEEVAARTGNDDFVTLHLDAQTDSKSLLGSYVVGATPGEFAWQPGALTQAVKRGRWVIIEDVDQAPFEVLAALVPLLEERRLYVPGRGESVLAAEGFQLFGTVTTGLGRAGGSAAAASRTDPLAGLWARVAVEPPSGDEPAAVLVGIHPGLAPLAPRMLATLNAVQSACGSSGAAAAPGGDSGEASAGGAKVPETLKSGETSGTTPELSVSALAETETPNTGSGQGRAFAGRPFTLRDLLRWARRLERLRASELSLLREGVSTSDALPPKLRAAAYEEAADVLCGMLPTGPGRTRVLTLVASVWGLSADEARHRDDVHKPSVRTGTGAVAVGRATLPAEASASPEARSSWSNTGHAMRVLERVASAVQCVEPVLLVGETGTGKTALVQQLARLTGVPLTVVNLSNQSESSDFLGGFRPAGARHLCLPLLPRFREAFAATFDTEANAEFLARVSRYAERRKWTHLLHAFRVGVERVAKLAADAETSAEGAADEAETAADPSPPMAKSTRSRRAAASASASRSKRSARGTTNKRVAATTSNASDDEDVERRDPAPPSAKRRRRASFLAESLVRTWRAFERDLTAAERAVQGSGSGPVFAFVEGALVTALKEGRWILFDEINLAPAETLERLSGVLESATGSVVLSERGDGEIVARHPRFRAFGAMNPATDVGKRDLPPALKHRFTEVYAGECEGREDLCLLVADGMRGVPAAPVNAVVDFYLAARAAARTALVDSAEQKPQYSLRTLSRALEYVRHAAPVYGIQRALYDGFAMSFQTLLKTESAETLERLMTQHLLRGATLKVRRAPPAKRSVRFHPSREAKRSVFSFSARARAANRTRGPPLQPAGSSSWTRRGPDRGGRATVGVQYLFSARRTEKCGRERARRAAPHTRRASSDSRLLFFVICASNPRRARVSSRNARSRDARVAVRRVVRSTAHAIPLRSPFSTAGCLQGSLRTPRRPPRARGAVLGRSRGRRARRPGSERTVRGDAGSETALVRVGARGASAAAPDPAAGSHVFGKNLAGGVPRGTYRPPVRPHQQSRAHGSARVPGELRHGRGGCVPSGASRARRTGFRPTDERTRATNEPSRGPRVQSPARFFFLAHAESSFDRLRRGRARVRHPFVTRVPSPWARQSWKGAADALPR